MRNTMEDYIREIPITLKKNIQNRKELLKPAMTWLRQQGIYEEKELVLVASGSSYNAIYAAVSYMNHHMKNPVRLISPFEYSYYEKTGPKSIYLFVSQSGCSTNIMEAVRKCQADGYKAMAVIGNLDSSLGKLADMAIEYGVGEELVGYVTKGVSALVCFCMLLALEISEGDMQPEEYRKAVKELEIAAENHGKVYEKAKEFCLEHEKAFLSMNKVMLLSCGANMGTIREGALKMAEMIHVQTTYYEVEEYIHGPNLQLTPEYVLFFVEGGDKAGERVAEIRRASLEMTDKAYLIGAKAWNLEPASEDVTPLSLMAFFQYLACWGARELDIRGEHPFYKRFKKKVQNKTEDYKEEAPF